MQQYKKATIKKHRRRGKTTKTITISLTKRAKAVMTLEREIKKQKSKTQSIPRGCNAKGKTSTWKRGGDFPCNRPRAGASGRTRWTKGNDFSNELTNRIYRDGTVGIRLESL